MASSSKTPIYDLTLSDDEVDRRSATPCAQTQVIDLTHASDTGPADPTSAATVVSSGMFTLRLFSGFPLLISYSGLAKHVAHSTIILVLEDDH